MNLAPLAETTVALPVVGGSTLEVTLAQYWSSAGSSTLDVQLAFCGVNLEVGAWGLGVGGWGGGGGGAGK
jgi:hypothetical protein